MKIIKEYISEALKISSKSKVNQKYYPKTKSELVQLIKDLLKERGYNANLNDIDTSEIKDMSHLFDVGERLNFDGNISNWNVSNVENMNFMFSYSDFTGNNGDISNWDVSNVKNMDKMFWDCKKLNIKLDKWDVSNVISMTDMFKFTPIKCHPSWYKK